jgi:hypothetical protein
MPTSPGDSAVERLGVQNMGDVFTFLFTEWVNYNGMNNSLLYDSGVYGQVGSFPPLRPTATIQVTNAVSSTDKISGQSNSTYNASSYTDNGALPSTSGKSPTFGEIFITNKLGTDGWSSYARQPFTVIGSYSIRRHNSYIAPGSMWIGDTAVKRAIWMVEDGSYGTTIASISKLPWPSSSPSRVGSGALYPESNSIYPTLPADPAYDPIEDIPGNNNSGGNDLNFLSFSDGVGAG